MQFILRTQMHINKLFTYTFSIETEYIPHIVSLSFIMHEMVLYVLFHFTVKFYSVNYTDPETSSDIGPVATNKFVS